MAEPGTTVTFEVLWDCSGWAQWIPADESATHVQYGRVDQDLHITCGLTPTPTPTPTITSTPTLTPVLPILMSITWNEVDDSGTINEDDTLLFMFSKPMDTGTITTANIDTSLPTVPSHTYGTLTDADLSWSNYDQSLTVTLGSGVAIIGGETVNPADSVTDKAGNPDATTGTGPAIPEAGKEGFVWQWWYTLLIGLGVLTIVAIVLLLLRPKGGEPEEVSGKKEES